MRQKYILFFEHQRFNCKFARNIIKMDKDNKISVIICTYNGEKYIREQIDSILKQTYPAYELIIQDDGSKDSTPDICKSYAQSYPFIKFYQNSIRLGFNENFRTATLRATGDYIALSDQDDVWYPDKLERQIAAIGNHDICFSCHNRGTSPEHTVFVTPQYALEALLFNAFAGHTMLLERHFAQDQSHWLGYIPYDWSLAIQAQLHHGIVRIEKPLNWHRTHQESTVAVEQKKFHKEFDHKLTYQPYLYGLRNYRALQQKESWNLLYKYIYDSTSNSFQPLAHTMSGLMLKKSIFALLHLCYLCMKHRHTIYYNNNAKGLSGIIRSFFYPFIFSYNNIQFDLCSTSKYKDSHSTIN